MARDCMIRCPRPKANHRCVNTISGCSAAHGCGSINVVVTVRNANYSAFNGRRRTASDYSELHCLDCGVYWRSNAKGVRFLRDATAEQT